MKNFKRFYSLGTTAIALGVLTASCGISDELDKINSIESVQAKGSLNANILDATWSLKNIIPTDELELKELPDGTYSLGFETSSDFQIGNTEFPSIEKTTNTIPLIFLNSSPEYNGKPSGTYYDLDPLDITFEIPKPEIGNSKISDNFKIEEVVLKQGAKIILDLGFSNDCNASVKAEVTIPSLTKNNAAYTKTFYANNGSAQFVMGDLEGYTLNTDPNIKIKVGLGVQKNNTLVTGEITPAFTIQIGSNTKSVKGFFGETELTSDPIETPISLPDLIKGNDDSQMTIREATIAVSVQKNGFTIPTDLDFGGGNLCYYKNNSQGKPINLERVVTGDPNTYKFKIKDINVMNIEKLVLNPKVTLNKGLTSGSNMITDQASINYGVNAQVPFDFKIENLVFEEEGENPFKDVSLEEEDYQIIDGRVMLKGIVNSELPIKAVLQAYYRNEKEDNTYLSPLFDTPIIINSGSNDFNVVITKEKLDIIKQFPYQAIQLRLDGTGSIKSSQKVTFKVGVAAKGTFKVKVK